MEKQKKRCTECGEEVLAIARKCKHCHSELAVSTEQLCSVPVSTKGDADQPPVSNNWFALLAIPLLAALLMYEGIGAMGLIRDPASKLTALGVGTLFITAALIAWEVRSQPPVTRFRVGVSGALPWFLFASMLWPLGYLAYLFTRSRRGLRNLLVPGVVVVFVFFGVWLVVAAAINSRAEAVELQTSLLHSRLETFASRPGDLLGSSTDMSEVARRASSAVNQGYYRYHCVDSLIPKGVSYSAGRLGVTNEVVDKVCGKTPQKYFDCLEAPGASAASCFAASKVGLFDLQLP